MTDEDTGKTLSLRHVSALGVQIEVSLKAARLRSLMNPSTYIKRHELGPTGHTKKWQNTSMRGSRGRCAGILTYFCKGCSLLPARRVEEEDSDIEDRYDHRFPHSLLIPHQQQKRCHRRGRCANAGGAQGPGRAQNSPQSGPSRGLLRRADVLLNLV